MWCEHFVDLLSSFHVKIEFNPKINGLCGAGQTPISILSFLFKKICNVEQLFFTFFTHKKGKMTHIVSLQGYILKKLCSLYEILIDKECINIMIANQSRYKPHKITFIQKKSKEPIGVDLVNTFPLYRLQPSP